MMKRILPAVAASMILALNTIHTQPVATSIEKLALDEAVSWHNPRFSPDGASIFVTDIQFHGIWEYSLTKKSIRQITSDRLSGYGYSIAPDGKSLAYRKTLTDPVTHQRREEIVLRNLADEQSKTIASGRSVTSPHFSESRLIYSIGQAMQAVPINNLGETVQVLGIENTKIALMKNDRKVLIDPLGHGSYIWPSFSPDKKLLVAYEVDRGTFLANAEGEVLARLGRRDAPQWTFDGSWIVFMDDHDDGHRILSSEISFIAPDGRKSGNLTNTPDVIELNPHCSPTERKIVYNTLSGSVYVLTYEE